MKPNLAATIQNFERQEEERAAQTLAAELKLPYVSLVNETIPAEVLTLISRDEAEKYRVVLYIHIKDIAKVATDRPLNPELTEFLKTLANRIQARVALAVCSKTSLESALKRYPMSVVENEILDEVLSKSTPQKLVPAASVKSYTDGVATLSALAEQVKRVNTSELMDVLFTGAIEMNATDIHLEPQELGLRIRFRIDGVLLNVAELPIESFQTLRSRVKYLAKLKLDVVGLPQDGRFNYKIGQDQVDVRTSSLPGLYGEIITLRLLPHQKNFLSLEELGFTVDQLNIINNAIRRPHGIILATGPTGSGKTTTLYAILAKLNKPEVKIMTLEDPIEYRLLGIDQSQVSAGGQYTFAKALRSALRQDPNILMVGEIRDGETAETAIEAAMTGHLVLSTLHTNDAPTAIPRLLEMGVKPFLLSGVINLVIAQRLVRKICPECRGKKYPVSSIQHLGETNINNTGNQKSISPLDTKYSILNTNCKFCHGTGYKGRVAITELLVPNRIVEDLIVKQSSVAAFAEAAKSAGMISMAEDGFAKVRAGVTTAEEIERVTGSKENGEDEVDKVNGVIKVLSD